MGDSGSQVLGFTCAALALTTSWRVAESTVATLILPLLVLAVPILDTALVTVVRLVEGRPIHPGRPRPHVAPARAARPLRAPRGGPARVDRRRPRPLEPRLQRARRHLPDAGRRAGHVRAARAVRGLPRRPRARAATSRRAARRCSTRSCSSRAGSSRWRRLRADGGVVQRRLLPRRRRPRTVPAPRLPRLGAGHRRSAYLVFIPAGLYKGVWRYAGAREAATVVAAVVLSELVGYGIIAGYNGFEGFPLSVFVDRRADLHRPRRRLALRRARPRPRPSPC